MMMRLYCFDRVSSSYKFHLNPFSFSTQQGRSFQALHFVPFFSLRTALPSKWNWTLFFSNEMMRWAIFFLAKKKWEQSRRSLDDLEHCKPDLLLSSKKKIENIFAGEKKDLEYWPGVLCKFVYSPSKQTTITTGKKTLVCTGAGHALLCFVYL